MKTPREFELEFKQKRREAAEEFGSLLAGPHALNTLVLLAFCHRKSLEPRDGFSTDGTLLQDKSGDIAKWIDRTRVIINEKRMVDDGPTIKRFLDYWGGYYHIGISIGPLEPEQGTDARA